MSKMNIYNKLKNFFHKKDAVEDIIISKPVDWIESRTGQNIIVLKFLVKYLDSQKHSRKEYFSVIEKAISDGYKRIILDFSMIEYSNTSWGIIDLILIVYKKLRHIKGKAAGCELKDNLYRILKVSKLDRLVPIFKTEEQAKANIRKKFW